MIKAFKTFKECYSAKPLILYRDIFKSGRILYKVVIVEPIEEKEWSGYTRRYTTVYSTLIESLARARFKHEQWRYDDEYCISSKEI